MTNLLRCCLLASACTGLLMACSEQGAAPATADKPAAVVAPAADNPALDVPALLEQAEALRLQAAGLDHEWSNHDATISAAREALDAGNSEDAARLASLAVLMGEQSLQQATTEAGRWRDAVPH